MILVLLAIIGLLAASGLREVLLGQALANARLAQQRAFALAELGLTSSMATLHAATLPDDSTRTLQPLASSTDNVVVSLRRLGSSTVPAGFSAGRFITHRLEIESSGHAARNTRVTQVLGVTRVLPATGLQDQQ